MGWSIRKNAADRPTMQALISERVDTLLEIETLKNEDREIDDALPHLREFEPGRAADAEDRKAAIPIEIANRQRRLAYIDDGIAKRETEERQKTEAMRKAAVVREADGEARKRTNAVLAKFAAAVPDIEWLVAHVDRCAEAGVVDGEKLARQIPGQTIPARFEEREFWRDGSGREATVLRKNERGEMVPAESGYSKVRERICVQPERVIPPAMPNRLAELLPALKQALGA